MSNPRRRVVIVGAGRAGGSFARVLEVCGWEVTRRLGRTDDKSDAAVGVDLVLITTPDAQIARVAAAIAPNPEAVVAHAAGSLGLDVLAGHTRVGAIHPLMSLSNAELGAARLMADGWFAIAGDDLMAELVADLGGRSFVVADDDRAVYHAAACVASPHVVALLGQVERLAASIAVPAEAFLALTSGSLENVAKLGAGKALTGPAARGDQETLDRHLAALADDERATYTAMVAEAKKLAASHDAALGSPDC